MRALLILNGEFSLPREEYDLVAVCDGAYDRVGSIPFDLFVGDCDSVRRRLPEGTEKILLLPEKDETDGEAAFRALAERGATEIVLIGALGGDRIDHVLTNLLLLKMGLALGIDTRAECETCRISALGPGSHTADCRGIKYVSLVPVFGTAHIKVAEGLKYPIRALSLDGSRTIGISNEPIAETIRIDVAAGEILMVLIFSSVRESV